MVDVLGTSGNDVLLGDPTYSLEAGIYLPTSDSLYGFAGDDLLSGRGGNDSLLGGSGKDTLYGDSGDDSLFGEDGDDALFGYGDNDVLRGGIGNDRLLGDDGNDTLYAEDGNDDLSGGAGNDTLFGESGNGRLAGNSGNDTFIISGGKHNLSDEQGDEVYQLTGLQVGGLYIEDAGGNDALLLNFPYTLAQAMSDIRGFGREGTSLFLDLNSSSVLEMDQDLYILDFFRDETSNRPGRSFIERFNDQSTTSLLNLKSDVVSGTSRSDTIIGGNGGEIMYGYGGDDRLSGNFSSDTIYGGPGNDLLDGGIGFDSLFGNNGNDVLIGDRDSDNLSGDGGDDLLSGGHDRDLLTGGAGRDQFVFDVGSGFAAPRRAANGSWNYRNSKGDTIMDFTRGQDKIVLDKSVFKNLDRITIATSREADADRLPQKLLLTSLGRLIYNQNGAAPGYGPSGGVFAAVFSGGSYPALTASDFKLVP